MAAVQLRRALRRGGTVSDTARPGHDLAILDLLDRVIEQGVLLAGDVTISVADVDLIYLGLRVLLAPVERLPELMSAAVNHDAAKVLHG